MRGLRALLVPLLLTLPGCDRPPPERALGGNVKRGAELIAQNGCGACHAIPGVRGARGRVGPDLDHIGSQTVLVGMLPNTPANMLLWVKQPQTVRPGDVMPNMGLNDADTLDIASYLYSLR